MLNDLVNDFLRRKIEPDKLCEEVSKVIKQAVETNDVLLLDQFFGKNAYKNYLTPVQLQQLNKKAKEKKDDLEDVYKYFNTSYLQLAFYYACKKGSTTIVKYFIEKQHMPGDLAITLHESQKFLEPEVKLKGPPLKLAVQSGNLDLVKYIYENTEATVETSLDQPMESTALMEAVQDGRKEIVQYLLDNGGNPNAEEFASWNTKSPLTIAIHIKNAAIIELLLNAGAIVTNKEVLLAIEKNIDITTIEKLLLCSVNREDPYNPYLLAAIKSGNIALLKTLEDNPLLQRFDVIAAFAEDPIEKRMLLTAATSGSVDMMKHLVTEKKLDLEKWLSEVYKYFDSSKDSDHESIRDIGTSCDTMLYRACNHADRNVIPLLQYLLEEQKITPSPRTIQKICSYSIDDIRTVAYLHSFLTTEPAKLSLLHAIAFNLDALSLAELFKMYNTKFIYEGNSYEMHGHNGFLVDIEKLIKSKTETLKSQELLKLVKQDKEIATGALFYYSTSPFDTHSETLSYLLRELLVYGDLFESIDIKNCNGETLTKFAAQHGCFNIVKKLLQRNANLDEPDQNGETPLNRIIDHPYYRDKHFKWIKDYISATEGSYAISHSLKYESNRRMGGYDGIEALLNFTNGKIGRISLAELWDNCKQGWNNSQKVAALLKNISTDYVDEMVRLVRDEGFNAKAKKYELDYFFSRVPGFDPTRLEPKKESTYEKNASVLFKTKAQDDSKAEDVQAAKKQRLS